MFMFHLARGRPSLQISDDQIRSLFSNNFTAKAIADALDSSVSYVYKRLQHMGLAMRSRYATLSDTELAEHVSQLQRDFPNCGAEV